MAPNREIGISHYRKRYNNHFLLHQVRRAAMKSALSSQFAKNNIVVVNELDFEPELKVGSKDKPTEELQNCDFKYTGIVNNRIRENNWDNVLFINDEPTSQNFYFGCRNIPDVLLSPKETVNVYDILRAKKVVIHKGAIPTLSARATGEAKLLSENEEPVEEELEMEK